MKHSILLAAKSERACTVFKELIDQTECKVITATDGSTMRCIGLEKFDIIIISLPLADEGGIELINDLREKTNSVFIALAKAENAEAVRKATKGAGAYVLEKPLSKGSVMQAIHFIEMQQENERELRDMLSHERQKNDELKILCTAKIVLIENEKMSEEEAHKFIQQRSMNDRKSVAVISQKIIDEYKK